MKKLLFLMVSLFAVSSVNAGYLVGKSNEAGKVSVTLPAGTALYLMPIEGFQVGANLPNPTYGLSLNEDLVLGDLSTVNGVMSLSPIVGVGASLYADASSVINGTGPLSLLGGVNVIGPDLDLLGLGNGQGLVPDISFTANFATGETKVTGGLTVFMNLGPGTAQKL